MATYTIGSGGDYATFSAFEAAITLPEADRTVFNVTGTIAESFAPLDADYTNGLTIQAATGEEADGAGNGARINGALNPTTTTAELRVYNLNVRDMVVQNLTGVAAKVDSCDVGLSTAIDAVLLGSGTARADFTNCIVRDGADDGVYASADSPNVTMDRCSFVNAARYNVLRAVLTNCLAFGAGNTDFLAASAGSDYNASGDTSAPGTTVYTSRTSADFVDYAGGNFNLAAGSSLQTAGSGGGPIGASLSVAANSAPVVNDQTFSVADSASNGTVIGTLVATDSDGTVDSYSISGTTLAINSTTGQITLADNAGIVAGTPITATATVTDDAGDTDTATVTVNVTNSGLSFSCYDADSSNAAITSETLSHVRVLDPADLSEVATATSIATSSTGSAEIDTDSVTIGTDYLVIARRSNGDVCEPFLVTASDLAAS